MEPKTKVEVEILGHKATIGDVRARVAYPPWHPEDKMSVYLDFHGQPVESILGFYVDLPVKDYGRDDFLEAVKREGEKQLREILERHGAEREEQLQREEKQKALDSIAEKIKSTIGLT